jgi:hypothetical protein
VNSATTLSNYFIKQQQTMITAIQLQQTVITATNNKTQQHSTVLDEMGPSRSVSYKLLPT